MDKLIIAPHVDDDVLGCGGIMGKDTFVLYCGLDETHINNRPDKQQRLNEIAAVVESVGYEYHILNNPVNYYNLSLIPSIEEFINKLQPVEIYIPYPSYNQDHRTVYEAALVALRPHDINFFVKKVFMYEQPHVFLWDYSHNIHGTFKPNYFRKIDIEKKIYIYKLMETQVRSFRSPETLRSMAQLRGSQSNCDYAEAFYTIRYVE